MAHATRKAIVGLASGLLARATDPASGRRVPLCPHQGPGYGLIIAPGDIHVSGIHFSPGFMSPGDIHFSNDEKCGEYLRMDEKLLKNGWDSIRYPWLYPKTRNSGDTKKSILYGTAFAQKTIWEHQNPKDCSNKTLAIVNDHLGGFGAHVHALGAKLSHVMQAGKILVHEASFLFADKGICGEAAKQRWECVFEPLSSCSTTSYDAYRKSHPQQSQEQLGFGMHIPDIFDKVLQCSGISRYKWCHWWEAQASMYLLRMNTATRQKVTEYRKKSMSVIALNKITSWDDPAASSSSPGPQKNRECPTISYEQFSVGSEHRREAPWMALQLRRGDKPTEGAGLKNFSDVQAALGDEPFLLMTDDPAQILAARQHACDSGIDMVVGLGVHRNNGYSIHMLNAGESGLVIELLAEVEFAALECTSAKRFLTLGSNLGRLVHELSATVGMNFGAEVVDTDSINKDTDSIRIRIPDFAKHQLVEKEGERVKREEEGKEAVEQPLIQHVVPAHRKSTDSSRSSKQPGASIHLFHLLYDSRRICVVIALGTYYCLFRR
jgi:hypothetical protein